jgi:RNA polymerase sigma-70 factor (ECF subfamily)
MTVDSAQRERDPDAELLARVAREDASAVRQLVARKLPRLLSLAVRLLGDRSEAEDVAQEAFVRIWKQAPHWREGEARFDTWLHRVAMNLCYDRLRSRRETLDADLQDARSIEAVSAAQAVHAGGAADDAGLPPTPEAALEARQDGARVRAALASLPSRQREALVLTYYQELSNAQTAALMGIGIEALESLLARARRSLRAQLTQSAQSAQSAQSTQSTQSTQQSAGAAPDAAPQPGRSSRERERASVPPARKR